jgi:DNA-binding NtrC family response regulator
MPDSAILCVDDEAIIVFSLKQELKARYGDRFVYETALSAEEALGVIGELEGEGLRLVLVISDWLMPGMRGDSFIRTVKQTHPGLLALIVTGQADERTIEELIQDGLVSGVIMKPWSESILFDGVERCLEAGYYRSGSRGS